MQRFLFQNPANQSWEADAETVIHGDDLLEDAQYANEDELDTIPIGQGPLKAASAYFHENAWGNESANEYLSEDDLEEAEPSAPSFSRPTFQGPLRAGAAFSRPAASIPAHLGALEANPLRRTSVPPAPLPPLPSRYDPPPQRAEMPTPVMEIFPSLEAIRPESRPPPPTEMYSAQAVYIPPPPLVPSLPLPSAHHGTQSRSQPPPFRGRASSRRNNAHLDTLRPYAASTRPGISSKEASPASWSATEQPWAEVVRPWLSAASERSQAFLNYSRDAVGALTAWTTTLRDTVWSSSRSEGAHSSRVRVPARPASLGPIAEPRWQKAHGAGWLAAQLFNARTATWALGIGFVALLVMAIRSPASVSVSAAPPTPIVVDADAIQPVIEGAPEKATTANRDIRDESDKKNQDSPLLLRARSGQRAAIAELNSREPTSLSLEEVQALAIGEEKIARENTARQVLKLARKRRLDADDRAAFLRQVGNPRTYREALLAMAENRSWHGPDLIYLAMRRYRSQEHVADFARSLLLTPRIYKYASPALTVVIDAESMTGEPGSTSECLHVRQLVDRALEEGDSRAVLHMARFAKTTGCGEDNAEDCYPCLREDSALVDALRAAKTRSPPF